MGVSKVKQAAKLMRDGLAILDNGPLEFYLTELAAAHDLLMERFAPFKVGDRVTLREAPQISEKINWGWLSGKHYLIPGEAATVVEASCGSSGFRFYLEFDNETWLDHGEPRPVSRKHTYCFGEDDLCAVSSEGKENG